MEKLRIKCDMIKSLKYKKIWMLDVQCYMLEKKGGRKKFDLKVIKGIFVTYATNNTYRRYISETKEQKQIAM